jgi:hypothetical protein
LYLLIKGYEKVMGRQLDRLDRLDKLDRLDRILYFSAMSSERDSVDTRYWILDAGY